MMFSITVVEPKSLDFYALTRLQQEAFLKIIEKTDTSYLFTENLYRWKYFPPAGNAKIALIKDEIGLVAANSMYPVDILAGNVRIRGWQSCDSATHPRGRGKGFFIKCLEALKAELGSDYLFFGFPNQDSKPGFMKLGWTHHSNVRTWIRLLPSNKGTNFSSIEPIDLFTEKQDVFSRELAKQAGAMFERGSAYMNWRYKQHPLHQYEAFGWYEFGSLIGVMVLRRANISGRRLAIVMEILTLSLQVERTLLAFAIKWGKDKEADYILVLNNTTHWINGIINGYFPIPMRALPKRQILMGEARGIDAQAIWNMSWRIQIGDWDGF